jgi:FkbH-like protein
MLEALTPQEVSERRRRGGELLKRARGSGRARWWVLSTFNVDFLPPFLADAFERAELAQVDITMGAFGQLAQQLLPPDSTLYRDAPDALVLVLAVEDLLEPLYTLAPSQLAAEDIEALLALRVDELRGWLGVALERLAAVTCYVALVGPATAPLEYVLDPLAVERGQWAEMRLREQVLALGSSSERVVVFDWGWHARGLDLASLHDPRLWYLARMRLSPHGLAALADLAAGYVAAARGGGFKVVAVDLDGVLWGGVVGEVGVGGVELGGDGAGFAFQDFQRELMRLRDCGLLLAPCSKNNPQDVAEVFAHHPAMVLRSEDFAAERVNWQDKASNLRELASELGLGLDSFVFLDDSPIEREWVRRALPEVSVPELPGDPAERPRMLRSLPGLRRIRLTDADRGRAAAYRAERSRRAVSATASSFEEFLVSLEQEVTIEPVCEASLARAAQLCQRTNQFNLTTRRYAAGELQRMLGEDDIELYTLAVSDRFGDSGITGLAILRLPAEEAEIDTFLMSCRVLGRRLEDALLAFLAERALARGARALVGRYEPTAKNAQTADFYAARRFEVVDADAVSGGTYRLDLAQRRPLMPAQARLRIVADA